MQSFLKKILISPIPGIAANCSMFTGIIEAMGTVADIGISGTNRSFWISSQVSDQLKIDQSVSHNGVCLTVDMLRTGSHRVTAVEETLSRTNLGNLKTGESVNLERCLSVNARLDGHLVQGHVDTTGTAISVNDRNGSWEYRFRFPAEYAQLVINKGSICLNGISLTVFDVTADEFTVAIIPYTYEHTNLKEVVSGKTVNLEFDMIGKYIVRSLSLGASVQPG
jgi:riboflavin synthase